MNVSSIVVKSLPGNVDEVISDIRRSGLCDVFFHDETGKIVVTIEGVDVSEEMRKLKEILKIRNVLSAELAYSYSENELNRAREEIGRPGSAVPEELGSY